ncbi:MAG: carboxypeptidase-like regulatory domain-containing protein, partial [Solirubrobacteraceae bacterium]
YDITACRGNLAGSSLAFGHFTTRGMTRARRCRRSDTGPNGIVAAAVRRPGRVPFRSRSIFTVNVPAGAQIEWFRWAGEVVRSNCDFAAQVYADGPGSQNVFARNRLPNGSRCPRPGKAQVSDAPTLERPRKAAEGTTRLVQRLECRATDGCSTGGVNRVSTFDAVIRVEDYTQPAVQITGGGLASGNWVGGRQTLDYTANDNVGVRRVVPVIGGVAAAEGDDRPCDFSRVVPCTNGPGGIVFQTEERPEGSQNLVLSAEDAANNAGSSQTVTTRIDNTAPARVDVTPQGGEGWRRTPDLALSWVNPDEGDRAPITAAHYRLCRPGTTECIPGRVESAGIAQLGVSAPVAGEYDVTMFREDAAGNQRPDNASVPVKLRYDPEPPQLAFDELSAADPTRISVAVGDRVSGVSGGGIEISRQGSGSWQPLDARLEGDHLVARIDDAGLPAGSYDLRSRAVDQAGNEASTDRRADGVPMTITLPLRIVSSLSAGAVRTKTVRRKVGRRGRKRTVRRRVTVLDARRRVRFGRSVRIAGRLTNPQGDGVPGAQVQVLGRTRTSPEQPLGTVTTDAKGRYSYTARASSSRTLRFAYAGTGTILPSTREVELLVPAPSTIGVDRRRVVNGQAVAFRGRLRSPQAGKLVELQVRLSGRFQTFKTVRTGPRGVWTLGYRFRRTCGNTRFTFRAQVPREQAYPFETGRSRPLAVKVRGRPCS